MANNEDRVNLTSKSMKLNMILNAVKGLMGIIFPLLTFPYVSRVLGVDSIGRYNFANSVISYFVLIAGLGISTYAIREGARIRNDSNTFKGFADQMFTINVVSTVFSFFLLFILMVIVPKFANYESLLIILSLQIIFKTIGIEWIYSIYEDYAYITIRSILFQVISLILLFVFVRTESDVNAYAAISVFSGVGSNLLNYIHARKYCKVGLVKKIEWKKHMKPIMVLFATSVTVTIYVSSDTTILGFLCSDYDVGIYSVSVKIYNIVKTILSSVLIVSIPRLSAMLGKNDKNGFSIVASDIYKTLLSVMLPAMIGIIILRREIILIVSGEEYMKASSSLMILSIALIFCMGAWFWGQCILVPEKKENVVFKVTIVSAIVNIVLNFILIPIWQENAAAFTTMIAEAISFFWCRVEGKKNIHLSGVGKLLWKVILGCISIMMMTILTYFISDTVIYTIISISFSVIIYIFIEIILKNEVMTKIIFDVIHKVKTCKSKK